MTKRNMLFTALIAAAFAAPSAFAQEVDAQALRDAEVAAQQAAEAAEAAETSATEAEVQADEAETAADEATEETAADEWPVEEEEEDPA